MQPTDRFPPAIRATKIRTSLQPTSLTGDTHAIRSPAACGLAASSSLLALAPVVSLSRHSRPGKQQAPQRLHRPLQRPRLRRLDRRPRRATRAKSPRCRPTNAPRGDKKMKKGIHEHWQRRRRRSRQRRQRPLPRHHRRLRRFRNVGRLEDRPRRRQRHLSPRRAAGANLGSDRPRSQQTLGADKGSGALWNNKKHERFPPVVADKPIGEWNRMYIRMVGPYVTVKLNDKKVVDNVILENYYDPKIPVFSRGPDLLANARQRNSLPQRLRPRDSGRRSQQRSSPKSAATTPTSNPSSTARTSPAGPARPMTTKSSTATLVCKAGKHGNLFTNDTYDNFVVRFEFKLPPGGNNGLASARPITDERRRLRRHGDANPRRHATRSTKTCTTTRSHGSLYGLAPALPRLPPPRRRVELRRSSPSTATTSIVEPQRLRNPQRRTSPKSARNRSTAKNTPAPRAPTATSASAATTTPSPSATSASNACQPTNPACSHPWERAGVRVPYNSDFK